MTYYLIRTALVCLAGGVLATACSSDESDSTGHHGSAEAGASSAGTGAGTSAALGANLSKFESSECKSHAAAPTAESGKKSEDLVLASAYDGLQCVEWEKKDERTLIVRLLNVDSVCGAVWEGDVHVDSDGAATLVANNPSCKVARCGSCLYDLSYELSGVNDVRELPVKIGVNSCPTSGQTRWKGALKLPVGGADHGIVCRHVPADALAWHASSTSSCSARHMPCGSDLCGAECDAGLSCSAIDGAADKRCLKTCTADADCGTDGTTSCVDGLCRLATSW
jgi:hypothetical protein